MLLTNLDFSLRQRTLALFATYLGCERNPYVDIRQRGDHPNSSSSHVHHVPACEWFAAQTDASVAFCRITQMGLLRLLTNPNVMGRAPRTILQAWEAFAQLQADRRLVFATEPDGVESAWRQLMTQAGVGPSSWTDAFTGPHRSPKHLWRWRGHERKAVASTRCPRHAWAVLNGT
jgi:hypothetical protein